MRSKRRFRFVSLWATVLLFLSMLTPAAGPVTVHAADEDDAISVDKTLEKDNDGSEQTVKGYIVGEAKSEKNVVHKDFEDDTNIAIADDKDETDTDEMLYVQVTDDDQFRDDFGLKSNPDNLGEEILVTGDLEEYFNTNGLKSPNDMDFADDDGEEPDDPDEVLSIEEARDQGSGDVTIQGVVTAVLKNTVQIQDDTGAIALRPASLDVEPGDEIVVSGSLDTYEGLLQIQEANIEEDVGTKDVPDIVTLAADDLKDHQSELGEVQDVTVTDKEDGDDWANYTAEDENDDTFIIRDEHDDLPLEADGDYETVKGIVSQFGDDYQIIPRESGDVIADSSDVQPVSATPEAGSIPEGKKVTLDTGTEDADIYYTTDGSDPADDSELYDDPIAVDEDMTLKAVAEKDGMNASDVSDFDYTVYDDDKGVMIHDIQGEGHESPMVGDTVDDVEGIVTYKYDIQGSSYFHMQTPEDDYDGNEKTSEGIVVYTGQEEDVDAGDMVEVSGDVDEYYIDGYDDKEETDLSVTQINARDDQGGDISVTDSDVELPDPVEVASSDIPDELIGDEGLGALEPEDYAIDYWESLEGMRVEVAPSEAVAPQENGDLFVKTDEYKADEETDNGGIRLTEDVPNAQTISFKMQPNDDARDFPVKTGDQFTEPVTGVVNYGFGNYKVYADLDDMKAAHEKGDTEQQGSPKFDQDDDKLTVAGYNVENFSNNDSKGETPDDKAEKIAKGFVDSLDSPDIVGVVEMQDNNGQDEGPDDADASKSYERLIDDIEDQGGPSYEYANIDPEYNEDGGAPDGNIRVGFLYNPDRVSLKDGDKGDATEAVEYTDGELDLNPGRVAPDAFDGTRKPLAGQFEFNGESVVVVANHLNSKLGDDPAFGQNQPPEQESREQRNELASELNGFVTGIEKDNPDENVVVLGDMNDFEFSEPLSTLKGDELTNLVDGVPSEDQYSYVHEGNSQVLDHMLVSDDLAKDADFDMVHTNSDFTEMNGRASDHDPVLAQLDLDAKEEEESDDDFELSLMHMNDTHAHVEPFPQMMTAIKEFREDHDHTMLFHAGDIFSGTLYFNEFKGEADIDLLNKMGVDAMAFGNHEFDLGEDEDGHESLSERVKQADFPFLGSNLDFSDDPYMSDLVSDESPVSMDDTANMQSNDDDENIYNSIIKEVDGEKIGIFGLTTEDTVDISSPADVTFENFKESAKTAVDELEDAGVNKIIAVNHIGYDSDPSVGNDLRLAEEVEDIDVIVGGHSHTELEEPVVVDEDEEGDEQDPTVIVQAGEYAEHLGTLDVTFDDEGVVTDHSGELLDVDDYDADEEMEEELETYKEDVDDVKNEEIGAEAKKDLTNPRQDEPGDDSVRANETELGNLVTDAMLAKAQEKFPETEIAFQNGGGIREAIDEGPITAGEVISVLPFGNDPVTVELSGEEIKEVLEESVEEAPKENGGFLHISGMQYYYDSTKDKGDRVVEVYLNNDGELEPIDPDEMYLTTTNEFTASGGDGLETFAEADDDGRVKDIGEIDWEQLRDYMVEEEYLDGDVDPEREDRIVDLEGDAPPKNPENPDNDGEEPDDNESGIPDKHGDESKLVPGHADHSGGDKDGDQLPKTSTDIYNFLLVGVLLIIAGGLIFYYQYRKKGLSNNR